MLFRFSIPILPSSSLCLDVRIQLQIRNGLMEVSVAVRGVGWRLWGFRALSGSTTTLAPLCVQQPEVLCTTF